jgi:hypothetical protein
VAVVKEGDEEDDPVVKAGEDDGELGDARDRSWLDGLGACNTIFHSLYSLSLLIIFFYSFINILQ